MADPNDDKGYVDLLLSGIRRIKEFEPQLGKGRSVSLDEFSEIYGDDPLYHWVGFDSPMMYAAHRTAGAMTSMYRNLGSGCENLFKQVLRDQLGLTEDDIKWTYVATSEEVGSFAGQESPLIDYSNVTDVAGAAEDLESPEPSKAKSRSKSNTLDGRIDVSAITVPERVEVVKSWLEELRKGQGVVWDPLGAVFEVRQGYKSMDSKRQAADIANASQALQRQRMPVLVVMSKQIDDVLVRRYRASGWGLLKGDNEIDDPLLSTFAFFEQILGYDLVSFFERNHETMRAEVEAVLRTILGAAK
ncbi:MAG: hypothetical protein ACRDWY_12790 [Actinomycetes bacterium]